MKVCIFEDSDDKFHSITDFLHNRGVSNEDVCRISVLSQATSRLSQRFDLIIVDLIMPYVEGGESFQVGNAIAELIRSTENIASEVLIITEYAESEQAAINEFAGMGYVAADYDKPLVWKSALGNLLNRVVDKSRFDFIGICAVDTELTGLLAAGGFVPRRVSHGNLVFEEVMYKGHKGALIKLPRMGPISAAIVTAQILEQYNPKVIFMSGICGGLKDGYLGRLLVYEVCWEYQSGKWTDAGFEQEFYPIEVDSQLRPQLDLLIDDKLLEKLEVGLPPCKHPNKKHKPKFGVFVTGSAVVATESYLAHIKGQHRRINGLDMEVFAVMNAVRMSRSRPKAFAAKAVVDRASKTKSDRLHSYCSYVSAKFCLEALEEVLK